jgi:hypothetical protein
VLEGFTTEKGDVGQVRNPDFLFGLGILHFLQVQGLLLAAEELHVAEGEGYSFGENGCVHPTGIPPP